MSRFYYLPFLVSVFFSSGVFCQARSITESDYFSAYDDARQRIQVLNRRVETKEEYFKNGKLSGLEKHLHEYIVPGKERYVYFSDFGGKIETRETIKIDGISYCKEANGVWERTSCDRNTGMSIPKEAKYEFSVINGSFHGKAATRYRRLVTYDEVEENSRASKRMYLEWTFYLDSEGLLIGQELNRGYMNSDEWRAASRTVYEYRPNGLKIESPIK